MERPIRSWQWAPTVFAAVCGQDVVLLDVSRDDYLVLAGAGDQVGLEPTTGRLDIADDALAAQLSSAALIVPTNPSLADRRQAVPEARSDIFSAVPVRPRFGDWLAFVWALIEMIPLYWLRPFGRLVSSQEEPSGEGARTPSETLIHSALVFERMLVWAPFQGKCLFRAAMLRRFLHRRGFKTAWVFGARTWPFAAHCWLQVGDVVINDRVDHVARFAPVMVV
jgi:hypothetical protein